MGAYSKDNIKIAVRRTLDQNTDEVAAIAADPATLELDEIIEGHILTAARNILSIVPIRVLDNSIMQTVNSEAEDVGAPQGMDEPQIIGAPSGFFRVYDAEVIGLTPPGESKRCEGWQIHLQDYEECTGEEYAKVHSAFPGIRPNPKRPKLFFNRHANEFEFYGCSYGTAYLRYVVAPAFIDNNLLSWPERLYDALIHMICALVEASYKDTAGYQLFMDLSSRMLGIPMEALENKDKRK